MQSAGGFGPTLPSRYINSCVWLLEELCNCKKKLINAQLKPSCEEKKNLAHAAAVDATWSKLSSSALGPFFVRWSFSSFAVVVFNV